MNSVESYIHNQNVNIILKRKTFTKQLVTVIKEANNIYLLTVSKIHF